MKTSSLALLALISSAIAHPSPPSVLFARESSSTCGRLKPNIVCCNWDATNLIAFNCETSRFLPSLRFPGKNLLIHCNLASSKPADKADHKKKRAEGGESNYCCTGVLVSCILAGTMSMWMLTTEIGWCWNHVQSILELIKRCRLGRKRVRWNAAFGVCCEASGRSSNQKQCIPRMYSTTSLLPPVWVMQS